jgi:signal transduction histidine kinase
VFYGARGNTGRTAAVIALLGAGRHAGPMTALPMTGPGPGRAGRRRSVRARLALLYGVLFLMCGAVLLAISNGLGSGWSDTRAVPAGAVPGPAAGRQQALADAVHVAVSHRFLLASLLAFAVMAVLSVLLGWLVAGRVLRPLRQMTAATQRISADRLHERLAMPGPGDELTDLADTIDGVLARLEDAFAAQRRFVANASHELRTPLATMRAALDVAEAKPGPVPPQTVALAGRIRAELDRTDELLEGLLTLARAQHAVLPGDGRVRLADTVAGALAARADAITARGLTVRQHAGSGGDWVQGSAALLARMTGNVIDNAVAHNQDGGWIRAVTGTTAGRACLVTETGGPVLDPAQVALLAQPFRRLGADRTGSDTGAGLGLSIVAAIAAAHGGTLELAARDGGGLRVTITLPLAQPPAAARQPAGAGWPG